MADKKNAKSTNRDWWLQESHQFQEDEINSIIRKA
jgi:hypothetical protein